MRLAFLLLGCVPLFGQTPPTPPVTKAPGDRVTLNIFATSQPSRAPLALRWELIFPVQWMAMDGDPETGSAAEDSGKSLQCTAPSPYRYACTLSGGEKPIADGLVAVFHLRILTTAPAGTATLKIEQAQATAADSKQHALDPTQATFNIR